jgi:glycosyltransferase involved in cell wall biosynthesis
MQPPSLLPLSPLRPEVRKRPSVIAHLLASRFFGGPERQVLGLGCALRVSDFQSHFLLFPEGGACHAFAQRLLEQGLETTVLDKDTPRLYAAFRELVNHLRSLSADLLCCHGYKANLLGRFAARRLGIPVVAVSRGWTGENLRIRLYDALDRRNLRYMDRIVCVSEAQAARVRATGAPADRVHVIHNAVEAGRFQKPDREGHERLRSLFQVPVERIVAAAGRLSPEKGFDVLIDCAVQVLRDEPSAGFVLFGEGPLRGALERQIAEHGLRERVVLAGFRADLDRFLPFADLLVLPSYSEGLPNVVLEAFGAGVPVVATAVGGTPEVVEDGVNGYLVPAGNAQALGRRVLDVLRDPDARSRMGQHGRCRVLEEFTFESQSARYQDLFRTLLPRNSHVASDRERRFA